MMSSITLYSCFLHISSAVGSVPSTKSLPMTRSMLRTLDFSRVCMMEIEVPFFPARPVRPLRWV